MTGTRHRHTCRWLTIMVSLLAALLPGRLQAQKQGQALVDSLQKLLPAAKEDTGKVRLLFNLSNAYGNIKPDEGVNYGKQCLALAEKLHDNRGIAMGNSAIGHAYYYKGDHKTEETYYAAALKMDEETGNIPDKARDYFGMATCQGSLINFPEALSFFHKSETLNEQTGDKVLQARVYIGIGNVHFVQSDLPHALEYYFKSLKINNELQLKSGIASSEFSIGNVYTGLKEYGNALTHYQVALAGYEGQGNKYGVAMASQAIGNVYDVQKKFDSCIIYDLKALKLANDIGIQYIAIASLGNIGHLYSVLHMHGLALAYGRHALQMAKESGDKHHVAWQLSELGAVYLDIAQNGLGPAKDSLKMPESIYPPETNLPTNKAELLRLAERNIAEGLDSARKYSLPEVMQTCYNSLSAVHRLRGDYKMAMLYFDSGLVIRDSIHSNERADQLTKIAMDYSYRREKVADSVARADAIKADAAKLERQRRYTWIGLGGTLLLAGLLFVMVRNNKLLGKEKQKSEKLLLNILPAEVADELKTSGSTVARHFDNVTVMFTDFVNFTTASERMDAQQLIDELHNCFKAFDEIAAKHNVEKIKTIGDAYLAVAGLPVPDARHAESIIRMANEIRTFMAKRLQELGDKTFEVRIGIHSGSVVAGIVGVKKFAYDIWGDTVNTAARMEQNSEPGKINISQTTFDLVKDKVPCTYRGEIEAKNKGSLKMYYVTT